MGYGIEGKILGVTPVRGGSKGIPRKNIKELAGKPLIAWTIESARNSKLLDEYIISTEDSEIAAVAEKYSAKVLARPYELAQDETSTLAVLQHVLEHISADIVVLLQATSPMRYAGLIDECIKKFIETGADSLATGFMCKYAPYASNNKRRQDMQGFFYDDGNVYVIKADVIRKGDRYGKRIEQVLLDRKYNIEIDEEFDFWLAEEILKSTGGE